MDNAQQRDEAARQIITGNGYDTEETRGMTLRELLLETRQEVKDMRLAYPTRKEIYSVIAVLSTIAAGWTAFL